MMEATQASARYQALGKGAVAEKGSSCLRLRAATATVEVAALAAGLFRVGMFPDGRAPDYPADALGRTEWDASAAEVALRGEVWELRTAAAVAVVSLDPLRIRFLDPQGRAFGEDDPELGMGWFKPATPLPAWAHPVGPAVRLHKRRPPEERYFGCGERTSGLEKTGSHQVFWNTDPPVGHTASLNNLYTSIPFLLALEGGRAWGLFFDNPGRVEFDLAHDDPSRSWFGAQAGDLIYYVFAGPTPRAVLERYTELTGRTPLPPLWALGNHQSRYSYMSADELREIARQFRQREIPCDALYLDIDFMDRYRVFTWDPTRFPDPSGLTSDLQAQGFRVVTIVDPGVAADSDYRVYAEGRQHDLFCKTGAGEEYQNVVWPGWCAFPDFSSVRARAWWGQQHKPLVDSGVAGIWCDMNEPAVFVPAHSTMPDDVVHPGDGRPRMHGEIHNLYGSLMARATWEALRALRPERRPFVISRSGYAGLQRYALQWTGDNSSWWEHLWMSMPQLQNMGLSGLAWCGVDVGGFWGDATGELLARWTEFGVFQPLCRNHSALGTRRQEPWMFGEPYESVIRQMLQLRQRLLPYLYSAFEECHRTGAPILRALLFEYPDDPVTFTADDEFLLGDALLLAPITRPGIEHRHVYLPRGTWHHLWSGDRLVGPAHILAHAPLGRPAVFVKANTPIPLWPPMNYVGERSPDPLSFLVFPAEGKGALTLYEDAGEGFEHETGLYARREVSCEGSGERVRVRFASRQGRFVPPRGGMQLELRGFRSAPAEVQVSSGAAQWQHDPQEGAVVVSLGETEQPLVVEVTRR